jgi:transposase
VPPLWHREARTAGFLADNAHFTKRFAFYVGRRCRQASIRDVAKELKLDWDTVKALEKQYMQAQLMRAGMPGPRVAGIDEISIRKGHSYRIVVSDLDRKRPIWFGGTDRSEASMAQFYDWLGAKKSGKIELAVMDMWKPFCNVTKDQAPQAAILFDKFHIMRHLGEALDKVRKAEYARLNGKDRRFIKGQKYNLLSRHDNLTLEGKRSLEILLAANKRLNTAYVLKETFGQLWDYGREGWARRFFENWRASLKWQRLGPYERFADLIDRHWDGIAAYCKPENKVSLGFVEGLNNKIRVFQRRAYGLRDEEYLRLKVLTCMLLSTTMQLCPIFSSGHRFRVSDSFLPKVHDFICQRIADPRSVSLLPVRPASLNQSGGLRCQTPPMVIMPIGGMRPSRSAG